MKGKYTLYTPDGPVEVENLITTKGRELILKHLAQDIADWSNVIAVGVSEAPPTLTDARLGYEIGRGAIDVATTDVANNRIIVKGTIPAAVIGSIREIGVFSSATEGVDDIPAAFSDFNVAALDVTGFTADTTNGRVGESSALLTVGASATAVGSINNLSFPMEAYGTLDEITLAYYHPGGVTSMQVRFYTSASGYYSYDITIPTTGYQFATWTKGAMTINGDASWLNPVIRMEVAATAGASGGSVALDGMTVYTVAETPDYGLVSRAVLATPQNKIFAPMDVEYAVEFSW